MEAVKPVGKKKKAQSPVNGRRRSEGKQGVTREQLLKHTEHDPEGAEEFVALLHDLRRLRASAALDESPSS